MSTNYTHLDQISFDRLFAVGPDGKEVLLIDQNGNFFPTSFEVTPSTSAPINPTNGQLYYDSTLKKFRGYQNGNWVDLDRDTTNVKDYGAKGDGTTDDTSAINSAIAALTNGGCLKLPSGTYKTTGDINVNIAKVILTGDGDNTKITLASGKSVKLTANSTGITNLWIQGPGSGSFASTNDNCINIQGANASSYITDIIIDNCQLSDHQGHGIQAQFVSKYSIRNNRIHDIAYAGIGILSCNNGVIDENEIQDINLTAGLANAYGVYISRNTGTTTTYPLSKYAVVSSNTVSNVTGWEALDTHAGQNIAFTGNVITNCPRGIVAGPDSSTNAPNHITISNNVLDSTRTDGTATYGIVLSGNSTPTYAEGCSITGNTVVRYGDQTSSTGCAIYTNATSGLIISGNTLIEPSLNGILATTPANIGMTIVGNTIIDAWSSTLARATGIFVQGNGHTGLIESNTFAKRSKSATTVFSEGIRFDSGATGINVVVGNHYSEATTFLANAPTSAYTGSSQVSLTTVGSSPNSNGASLAAQVLTLQPADGTHAGLITSGTQTIGGAKTFNSTVAASNLSGTNTGDQTIALTGDVTGSGMGSFATIVASVGGSSSTNIHLAEAAANAATSSATASTIIKRDASSNFVSGIYQSIKGAAPTSLTRDNSYTVLGGGEQNTNSYRAIGFGYNTGIGSSGTNLPVFIAYKETDTVNFGKGRLQFFTRNVNTDTAPNLALDIAEDGTVSIPNGIMGVTDGSNALSGTVGRYLESLVTSFTNFGTSGNYFDATSLSLPAGDWLITALIVTQTSGTVTGDMRMGITTTSGNSSTGIVLGVNSIDLAVPTSAFDSSGSVPNYRQSISSTTIYYLKFNASYSGATPQYTCRLSAVRIR